MGSEMCIRDRDERCEEVARMISGTDVTDLTLQNAGEMLRMAQEHS